MAQNITLLGANYSDVPAVQLPKTGGGTATFTDVTDTTAAASDVASGKYFYTAAGVKTEGTASGGGGSVIVTEEVLPGGGIAKHITAEVVTLQSKSVTPSETTQTVTPDTVYNGLSEVEVAAISSTYVGSGITRRSSSDITASGATVSVPSGYYASSASKAVSSGSEGTPTATKGSVSNHSITVTPSVTNTAGYIAGGTKTGTSVNISASELVSGSETITQNGTVDVTNLASVVVNVSGGGVQYDTKTVTASDYPISLSFTGMKGQPKFLAVRLNAQVSSSGSTTYYYIVDIISNGTTTHGNCFRIGSTRRIDNITSGYSWSYSGTTLTITSSAASRSASPGAFYSGSYELLYAY